MAKVPNGVETLPKILIAWVGCTNVTDHRRQTTDRRTDDMSLRSLKMMNYIRYIALHKDKSARSRQQLRMLHVVRGVGRNWRRGVLTFLPSPPSLLSFLLFPPLPSPFRGIPTLPFHSPRSLSLPYIFSVASPLSHPFPFPPFRSSPPLNQLGSLGERCKLPQRGPWRSFGRNRIWCTLELLESHR